jgi:hypothetical protein
VDEVLGVIQKVQEAQVHAQCKDTLKRLQASTSFRSMLQRGLKAPPATLKGSLSQLKVPADKKDGEEKPSEEIVGLIVRNPEEPLVLTPTERKSGALVVVVKDLEVQAAIAGTGVSTEEAAAAAADAPEGDPIPQ